MISYTTDMIFTYDALDLLSARADEAENAEDFFAEVDELVKDQRNTLPLPVPIEVSNRLEVDDDGENARQILQAVGEIDRANAADPRLWSFLALVTLRDYMLYRWPLKEGREFRGSLRDHWLLIRPNRRRLIRHGVARLWWIATLTYDPATERSLTRETGDPFAYTRWVFDNENRVQSIFERQLGSNPNLMWAVLEGMQVEAGFSQTEAIKKVTKELYLNTGYRRLEILEGGELEAIVQKILI